MTCCGRSRGKGHPLHPYTFSVSGSVFLRKEDKETSCLSKEWEHHVRAGWSQLHAIVLLGCRTYPTMGWGQHTWGLCKSELSGLTWSFHKSSQMSSHSWCYTGQHIFLYCCDFQSVFHSEVGMCCWYSLLGSPRTFPLIKLLPQIQDIRSKEPVNLCVLLFFIVCSGLVWFFDCWFFFSGGRGEEGGKVGEGCCGHT